MTAAVFSFSAIEKGATWRQKLLWTDNSETAINLTGCSVVMQLKKDVSQTNFLLELSTSNGRITLDALNGVIYLMISADDTLLIDVNFVVYDLLVIFSEGSVVRLLQGGIAVNEGVTHV